MSANTSNQSAAQLHFVRHRTRYPEPKWYIGLDLGQRKDHTAISVLELSWLPQGQCRVTYEWLFQPILTIRGLERFPLGTSYEQIHKIVADRIKRLDQKLMSNHYNPRIGKELVIDAGGPGPPMVDRLRLTFSRKMTITPVIITSGKGINTLSGGYTGIPRRTILSGLVLMIGAGTITRPRHLPGWELFEEEMLELTGDSTQPASESAHDDLVLATGLAAWAATRDTPELRPGGNDDDARKEEQNFGYIPHPLF